MDAVGLPYLSTWHETLLFVAVVLIILAIINGFVARKTERRHSSLGSPQRTHLDDLASTETGRNSRSVASNVEFWGHYGL